MKDKSTLQLLMLKYYTINDNLTTSHNYGLLHYRFQVQFMLMINISIGNTYYYPSLGYSKSSHQCQVCLQSPDTVQAPYQRPQTMRLQLLAQKIGRKVELTHKSSWVSGISSDFAVHFDQALLHDLEDFIAGERVFETVTQENDERQTFPQFMGTGGRPGRVHTPQFVQHPCFGRV